MLDKRPKNLNLFTIHFPMPAIVSILHRISGLVLFLLIPLLLWALSQSLTLKGFNHLQSLLHPFYLKLFIWVALAAFCFHLIAGIRHLLSDLHLGDTLKAGRVSAWLVMVLACAVVLLIGVWLW